MIGDKDAFYTEKELRRMGFKSVGEDVRVSKLAVIRYPEEITIGSHVAIDPFVYISVKMDIGSYVHIPPFGGISGGKQSYCRLEDFSFTSEGCKLVCGSDDFSKGTGLGGPTIPKKYRGDMTYGTIVLKQMAGLGTNVTILPNITIETGSMVGACSLVTKNTIPWGLYYGIPAKLAKMRPNSDEITRKAMELLLHG